MDAWLAIQGNDIIMDEGASTFFLQGQGKTFAIRSFQGNIYLQLGDVLFGDVDDPPELVSKPVSFKLLV
jgi:hypothetical protein